MKQYILLGILSGLIFFVGLVFVHQSQAWYKCHYNCVTPTVTPVVTNTPTPTAIPSDTPVPTVPPAGHGDGLHTGGDGLGCSAHDCSGNKVPSFPNSPVDNQPVGWK